MNKLFLYIYLILHFISCKSQTNNAIVIKNNNFFEITIDTLNCKNTKKVSTQYIRYINSKDKNLERKINTEIAHLFSFYIREASFFKLKQFNEQCCLKIDSCDFYVQKYQLSFKNDQIASLGYKTYIHSYSLPINYSYVNFDLTSGDLIEIQDIFTQDGLSVLKEKLNKEIITELNKEKNILSKDELVLVDHYYNNSKKYLIKNFSNFRIFEKNKNYFIHFPFSFNASKYENELLPNISLEYNLIDLKNILTKGFIARLN